MAFCEKCGTQIPEGSAFCPGCGAAVSNSDTQNQQNQQYAQYQNPVQPNQAYNQPYQNADMDIQYNKSIAWLAYLGILLLIPLFVKKDSEYCKFHVKQGANLLAFTLVYSLASGIIRGIVFAICSTSWALLGVYSTIATILGLVNIFFLVLAIIGIVNAATGKKSELPLISKVKIIPDLMDKAYNALNK